MDNKDKEHHLRDAKKLLTELPNAQCNIEGTIYKWKDIIQFRMECINEFMTWVTTEKLDHIIIDRSKLKPQVQHFK